jgi:hypothetical protein
LSIGRRSPDKYVPAIVSYELLRRRALPVMEELPL